MSLDGKVCIITGGGSGIGRCTALAMARDGASVALVGRTQAGQRVGFVGGQCGGCQQNADQRAAQLRHAGGAAVVNGRQAVAAPVVENPVVENPVVENVGFHGRGSVQPRGWPAGQPQAEAWLCRNTIVHAAGGGATRWGAKRASGFLHGAGGPV